MSYADKHALRDGRIVLYTRNGSPNFHARLKVDGVRGYIVKSSKTASLAAAVRWAEDLYDDLRYKARYGLEVRRHSFEALWKRWLQANEHRLSPHRTRYIRGTVERYLLPYFGDRSLEEVTDSCVEAYWSWRIAYWSSGQGTEKLERATTIRSTPKHPRFSRLGNIADKPSQRTLQMEQSVLRQIFSWALRMGIIQRVPTIKAPAPHRPLGISRRPAFEREEWNALRRFLRDWAQGKGSAPEFKEREGRNPGLHKLRLWQRQMLENYVLFMRASGLRPNEARQLKWKDVEIICSDDGEGVLLHISPTTKTGARECVPLQDSRDYLLRLKELSSHNGPDDYVFCDKSGAPIGSFGKTFKRVLEMAGLLNDRTGAPRTIYSLRHTYATFRLLYGGANIEDLAQNMGTSPTQIFNHYRHISVRQKAKQHSGAYNSSLGDSTLYLEPGRRRVSDF
jgi:integrase